MEWGSLGTSAGVKEGPAGRALLVSLVANLGHHRVVDRRAFGRDRRPACHAGKEEPVLALFLPMRGEQGSAIRGRLPAQLAASTRPARTIDAIMHATRDQAAIERELLIVPGPKVWRPSEIDVDGVSRPSTRFDRGDDWIAFCDLNDECLYGHAQQPNRSSLSVVTITDIAPYEEIDVR